MVGIGVGHRNYLSLLKFIAKPPTLSGLNVPIPVYCLGGHTSYPYRNSVKPVTELNNHRDRQLDKYQLEPIGVSTIYAADAIVYRLWRHALAHVQRRWKHQSRHSGGGGGAGEEPQQHPEQQA
uniref:Uncharacterized protein n=1 Tax=Schistocephalus solidus TaxID=70667 RepID=A0A0V0J1N5_SCHSO